MGFKFEEQRKKLKAQRILIERVQCWQRRARRFAQLLKYPRLRVFTPFVLESAIDNLFNYLEVEGPHLRASIYPLRWRDRFIDVFAEHPSYIQNLAPLGLYRLVPRYQIPI